MPRPLFYPPSPIHNTTTHARARTHTHTETCARQTHAETVSQRPRLMQTHSHTARTPRHRHIVTQTHRHAGPHTYKQECPEKYTQRDADPHSQRTQTHSHLHTEMYIKTPPQACTRVHLCRAAIHITARGTAAPCGCPVHSHPLGLSVTEVPGIAHSSPAHGQTPDIHRHPSASKDTCAVACTCSCSSRGVSTQA